MRLKVYGTPDTPPHVNPTEGGASTLQTPQIIASSL